MTNRKNIIDLAEKVGAEIQERDGRIWRVIWDDRVYGDGMLFDLITFSERARRT